METGMSGQMGILEILFGAFLGTVFSIITTIIVESLRKPSLEFSIQKLGSNQVELF
jgi:hypothetical protein